MPGARVGTWWVRVCPLDERACPVDEKVYPVGERVHVSSGCVQWVRRCV